MATKIAWTDETWNPVVGCTKVSTGCKNCYAEKMANRLAAMGDASPWKNPEYMGVVDENGWTGKVELCEHRLEQPLHWRKPRRIFVCSMSDLFHEKVPFEFIQNVLGIMSLCPQHTFLILTKRVERMAELSGAYPDNCHPGVSICTQDEADEKIPILLQIPAAVRWLSIEPLLEAIDLWDAKYPALGEGRQGAPLGWPGGLDWVVIGCESGPKRRPCKLEWIQDLVNQCKAAGVPVFVKQVEINGKVSHDPAEWPEGLRKRELPNEISKTKN